MAQRRMFSLKVIGSARFIKMPSSARLLYYDLGMHADDDGIVEAYTIMKATGASEDDLKILAVKGFIKILNEDLVAYITDWNEHNLIRADRKVDSIYKNLLLRIVPEIELIEPKPRADTGKVTGQPLDGQWTAQVRLGKVRLGKVNKKNSKPIPPKSLDEVLKYISDNNLNVDGVAWYKHFEAGDWYDSYGNPVLRWRQKLQTYHRNGWMKKTAGNDFDATALREKILKEAAKADAKR